MSGKHTSLPKLRVTTRETYVAMPSLIHGSLDPHHLAPQTRCRSAQRFLQGLQTWPVDRHTDGPKVGDALQLGRQPQAWRKVMAAYPTAAWMTYSHLHAGWLPVLRDQFWARPMLANECDQVRPHSSWRIYGNSVKTLALIRTHRTHGYHSYYRRHSSDLHAQVNVVRRSGNAARQLLMDRFEEPFSSGPLLECDSRVPLLTCDSLRFLRAVSVAAHLSDGLNDKASYIDRQNV